jgi:hypothetical protein
MRSSIVATVCVATAIGAGLAHAQKQPVRMSVPTTDYVYQYVPPQPRQAEQLHSAAAVQHAPGVSTNYLSERHDGSAGVSRSSTQNLVAVDLPTAAQRVASVVYTGYLQCELGAAVLLEADTYSPGYFKMQHGQSSYRLSPVATTTGAVRLEDAASAIVWLQLANKSMLLNQSLGTRLADECVSPEQSEHAQAMRSNPSLNLLQ